MRLRNLGFAILLAPLLLTSFATAQPAAGKKKMMMAEHRYDTATVATVQGTIEEVKIQEMMPGMQMMRGVHLVLKVGAGVTEVHVGPEKYLSENKIAFAKGDVITVIGSKLKIEGTDAIIAREIKRGAEVFTFRDEAGVPKWQMGGMGMMKGRGKGMMKDKQGAPAEKEAEQHQH